MVKGKQEKDGYLTTEKNVCAKNGDEQIVGYDHWVHARVPTAGAHTSLWLQVMLRELVCGLLRMEFSEPVGGEIW